jgi:hypothetical protein
LPKQEAQLWEARQEKAENERKAAVVARRQKIIDAKAKVSVLYLF